MKTILLFGAGKSATSLISYLGKYCAENEWQLIVCDTNIELAASKTKDIVSAKAVSIDVSNEKDRGNLIAQSDIVISMLPPALHFLVAEGCVLYSKNLLTASYIDEKIKLLADEIETKGLIFLGEMGLDPGIDHMSAMRLIHSIINKGGKISSFKSHCGGLVAPESDDNPWHYKITWNPANVVMAGSSGAVYRNEGHPVEIPYKEIFNDEKNTVAVPGLFPLAWYANRDSLSYLDIYRLDDVDTFMRTTLRYPSFCRGWNKIVKLGLTSIHDYEEIKKSKTIAEWFNLKKEKFASQKGNYVSENEFFDAEFLEQIDFLSMRSSATIPLEVSNSASLLQYLLERHLVMKPNDKDMIVMLHEIEYLIEGKKYVTRSCLIVKGEDSIHTAMAKTVGLPLGIATKLILQNKIQLSGLHIPVIPEIYEPVLEELELNGIRFVEETTVD